MSEQKDDYLPGEDQWDSMDGLSKAALLARIRLFPDCSFLQMSTSQQQQSTIAVLRTVLSDLQSAAVAEAAARRRRQQLPPPIPLHNNIQLSAGLGLPAPPRSVVGLSALDSLAALLTLPGIPTAQLRLVTSARLFNPTLRTVGLLPSSADHVALTRAANLFLQSLVVKTTVQIGDLLLVCNELPGVEFGVADIVTNLSYTLVVVTVVLPAAFRVALVTTIASPVQPLDSTRFLELELDTMFTCLSGPLLCVIGTLRVHYLTPGFASLISPIVPSLGVADDDCIPLFRRNSFPSGGIGSAPGMPTTNNADAPFLIPDGHKLLCEKATGNNIIYFDKYKLEERLRASLVFRRMASHGIQSAVLGESTYALDLSRYWCMLQLFNTTKLSLIPSLGGTQSHVDNVFTGKDRYNVVSTLPWFRDTAVMSSAFQHLVLGEWGPTTVLTGGSSASIDPWASLSLQHFSTTPLTFGSGLMNIISNKLALVNAMKNLEDSLVFLYGIAYCDIFQITIEWLKSGPGMTAKWKPLYLLHVINVTFCSIFMEIKNTAASNFANLYPAALGLQSVEGICEFIKNQLRIMTEVVSWDGQVQFFEEWELSSSLVGKKGAMEQKTKKVKFNEKDLTVSDEVSSTSSMLAKRGKTTASKRVKVEQVLCRLYTMSAFGVENYFGCNRAGCAHLHPKDILKLPHDELWSLVAAAGKGFSERARKLLEEAVAKKTKSLSKSKSN